MSRQLYILVSGGEPVHAGNSLDEALEPLRDAEGLSPDVWADMTRIGRHWVVILAHGTEFHVWRVEW